LSLLIDALLLLTNQNLVTLINSFSLKSGLCLLRAA
jgi:hypothetical protein